MFELKGNGSGKVRFAITGNGDNTWTFHNNSNRNSFFISKVGTNVNEFIVDQNGNGTFRRNSFAVQHVNTSSRAAKTDFSEIDPQEILTRLASLPVSQWRYKVEDSSSRHIGPVAEDFKNAFDLGDGKTVSTVDASGIALAAIKGLKIENEGLVSSNENLLAKLQEQEDRIMQLEMALAEILRNQSGQVRVGEVSENSN